MSTLSRTCISSALTPSSKNERCDQLATEAMNQSDLEDDLREVDIKQLGMEFNHEKEQGYNRYRIYK